MSAFFYVCTYFIPLWALCQTSRILSNGMMNRMFPVAEWDTFRYSFDVTNCIFDAQAHPNDKHLLLQNSLWYLPGKLAGTARRLVRCQCWELEWHHFVSLAVKGQKNVNDLQFILPSNHLTAGRTGVPLYLRLHCNIFALSPIPITSHYID